MNKLFDAFLSLFTSIAFSEIKAKRAMEAPSTKVEKVFDQLGPTWPSDSSKFLKM